MLRIVSIEAAGVVRLAAEGSITRTSFAADEENPFVDLLGPNWARQRIVLDLEGAEFIDSRAITWLLGSLRELREQGGRLALHSLRPQAETMLRLLNLHGLLRVSVDEAAAREAAIHPSVTIAA